MITKKSITALLVFLAFPLTVRASESLVVVNNLHYKSAELEVRIRPASPNQIASFYIGRGFPSSMVKRLRETCYFTIGVSNKSKTIIWHDLSWWRFYTRQGPLTRYDRAYWKTYWEKIGAPLPSQSTFRWTLMPEKLDFRPHEHEGGNIILHRQDKPFTIEAVFRFGKNKPGKKLMLRFPGLRCAVDK